MTDAFGGSRVSVRPPERGIFPLDHDGECRPQMRGFLECLRLNNSEHNSCREQSKTYLQCRMDKELMAKEDLSKLGLGEGATYTRVASKEGEKESIGFVAGLGVRASNKGIFK